MNIKRILSGALALICALGLLAGCGSSGSGGSSAVPGGSSAPAPGATSGSEGSVSMGESDVTKGEWYELDGTSGVLTVRLPLEKSGYEWNFLVDDEEVLELLTQENTEDTYVASFRALADGEAQITFSYVNRDAVDQARLLEVRCKDGKVTEVPFEGQLDLDQEGSDDPEVLELREVNDLAAVLREHHALTRVSEVWDGENNWQYKTLTQFVKSDGRLWYDYEQRDTAEEALYYEAGFINDDVPGALYLVEKDGARYMELCPASEYEALVGERWLARNPGDYEVFVEREEDQEWNTAVVTTRRVNDLTGVTYDILYFIENDTGLITGMEVTEYSCEDGSVVSVTRSNMMYDEPRIMEERAAMEVLFPQDPCYLTLVINPGQDNEEEQSFQVAKNTLVEFSALEDWELFYDYACTQPMEWIDVGQNKLTVYAVLK